MLQRSMSEFLENLANSGDLLRISKAVDRRLEVAEITRRVAEAGGPALLFERVDDAVLPVATNLFGTSERLCRSLGMCQLDELVEIGEAAVEQIHTKPRQRDALSSGPPEPLAPVARMVKQAASQQVVRIGRDIDLMTLPALQCWPDESGPTLWGRLLFESPSYGAKEILCRAQIVDRNRLALIDDGFVGPGERLSTVLEGLTKRGLAFVPGGLAEALLTACAGIGQLSGLLAQQLSSGQPRDAAKAKTSELLVPASAEMIIEGTLDDDSPDRELIAASAIGQRYAPSTAAKVMRVATITHRASPLLNTIVHGSPHGELPCFHGALERLLLPIVRSVVPELVEFAMPVVGGWQRGAVLAIRKTVPQQVRRAASAFWGLSWTNRVKLTIVVDEDVSPHDWNAVLAAVASNSDFQRDIMAHDAAADPTDHARGDSWISHALAIDATCKLPGEQATAWPARLQMPQDVREKVQQRWPEFGLPAATLFRPG